MSTLRHLRSFIILCLFLSYTFISTFGANPIIVPPSDPITPSNPTPIESKDVVPGEFIIKTKYSTIKSLDKKALKLTQTLKMKLKDHTQSIDEFNNFKDIHHIKLNEKLSLDDAKKLMNSALGDNFIEYIEPDTYVHTNDYDRNNIWNKQMKPLLEGDPENIADLEDFDYMQRSESESESENLVTDFNIDPKLWGLKNSNGIDINVLDAWKKTQGDPNVIVAIVDTGINYNHPDLKPNIWVNKKEIANNGIDDDGNGFIDDVIGWDFANYDKLPYDDGGHGTHVAGTIAGAGATIKGVAPNVKLMGLKFLGSDGSGQTSAAIHCIDYAIANGAKVINNSWGGGGYSKSLFDVIKRAEKKGVLFVVASGNEYNNNDKYPSYPANYALTNVLSVAAVDRYGALADFSNYGKTSVHIGAPGVNIYSTYPVNTYTTLSGTSMAAPHVAGVAALIWSNWPTLNYAQVMDLMKRTVMPLNSLKNTTAWGGMVNVGNALQVSDPISGGNPTTPPDNTPAFDMDNITLYMEKEYYGSQRLISLYFAEEVEGQYDLIKEISYTLVGSSIPTAKRKDPNNDFLFQFYTYKTGYTLNVKVTTKKGKIYNGTYSLNTR